jgi:hypothetical protein
MKKAPIEEPFIAAGRGFEPRLYLPERYVLPLDDPAIFAS